MKETETSNEGSKKRKDLLSKYPDLSVGPRCVIFNPGHRHIGKDVKNASMELSIMSDKENIMIVPLVDSMNKGYDEIPVAKSKKTSEKTRTTKRETERKTSDTKATRKRTTTNRDEDR